MLEPEQVKRTMRAPLAHTPHTNTNTDTQTYRNRHTDTQISVMREIQVSNSDIVEGKGCP